jgi:thiamine biosynthesis lipoprotein
MQASPHTRRRVITMLAGAFAECIAGRSAAKEVIGDYEWRGFAMGSEARIIFSGVDEALACAVAAKVTAEIERLESALSLFREDSEIVRLNRDKILPNPTMDMYRALELALRIAAVTNGLFDPTVQALWEAHVDWFSTSPGAGIPPRAVIARALTAVDWRKIRLEHGSISLGPKQRLTLNGLGQGYVTDRIVYLLRLHGFKHVLVDLGEQRALGPRCDGRPWQVAREGTSGIELSDGALATSEGTGCILGAAGTVHHLFDPRTGRSPLQWRRVTVFHRSAAVADALSTALYAARAQELADVLGRFDGAVVWTSDQFGAERRWGAPAAAGSF